MAKQAEAERERRAKIINAEGEFQAAQKLVEAADIMEDHPMALQMRFLQTCVEIGAEKNTTIFFPIPIDMLNAMGLILLIVGILGFIPGLAPHGMLFGVFMVSQMHSVIHLLSGLLFVAVGFSENWELARRVTLGFAILYGLITVLGFMSANNVVLGMRCGPALAFGLEIGDVILVQRRHPVRVPRWNQRRRLFAIQMSGRSLGHRVSGHSTPQLIRLSL